MASKQHEKWNRDLFDHLDRKLSGCISCEIGESRDSHADLTPKLVSLPRGVRALSQQTLWVFCLSGSCGA